jgi:hypothetical protein
MRDTIDMAREAGIELDLVDEDEGQIWYITTEGMKAFEALVRADEREACAKVCEELPAPDIYSDTDKSMWDVTCMDCAAAIRARSKDEK